MRVSITAQAKNSFEVSWGGQSLKDDVSPCLRATDYKNPHCVWEIVYEDENRQTDSSRTDAE